MKYLKIDPKIPIIDLKKCMQLGPDCDKQKVLICPGKKKFNDLVYFLKTSSHPTDCRCDDHQIRLNISSWLSIIP